jgi:predicted nucleic acid-binding protein
MSGLTLDTGALVALERHNRRVRALIARAQERDFSVTIPAAVVIEWWRGQRGPAARLLDAFDVEPIDLSLARIAGEALSRVRSGPSTTDAVVMASAARRGDLVLTSDIGDFERLQRVFPMVRVLGV